MHTRGLGLLQELSRKVGPGECHQRGRIRLLQGSGNWGVAAGNNHKGSGHMSNEDSPEDGDSTPGARTGAKRQAKAKRNARQQDQNKQVRAGILLCISSLFAGHAAAVYQSINSLYAFGVPLWCAT